MQAEDNPWPREVIICPTDETAWKWVGADASFEAMLWKKGYEMSPQIIESWSELHIPDGFEIWDEDIREEYLAYVKNRK